MILLLQIVSMFMNSIVRVSTYSRKGFSCHACRRRRQGARRRHRAFAHPQSHERTSHWQTLCRQDKERENAAALEVLPDLLKDLDGTPPRARLTALIEGVLAANIFDWGAKACVDLYHNGTILEIYR